MRLNNKKAMTTMMKILLFAIIPLIAAIVIYLIISGKSQTSMGAQLANIFENFGLG